MLHRWQTTVLAALLIAGGSASAQSALLGARFAATPRGSTGFVDEFTLNRYGVVRRWYTQVPTLRLRERILALKQQEDLLFAASDKGLLHCLDAETGAIRWSQSISSTPGEVFSPALTKTFVYVTSNSQASQLDRATGQILFTRKLPSAAISGPGANDNFAYVQTLNNRIWAIAVRPDPEEENKKWPYKRKFSLPAIAWFYDTGSPLKNAPIVLSDRVIFVAESGIVYACSLRERNLYYRFIPGSGIAAPVSFRNPNLYVATVDYNLYSVDARTGVSRWRFSSGYPIYRQPVPFENEVFLTPEGGGLFCLSDADGKPKWVNEKASRVIAVSQKRVYAMSPTQQLLILDRVDGAILGSWLSPDFPVSAFNQTTDRIFLSTERGLIQCLAEKENVTPYMHEEPLPETPEESPNPDTPSDPPSDDASEPESPSDEMPAEESDDAPAEEPAEEDAPEEEMESDDAAEGEEPAESEEPADDEMPAEESEEAADEETPKP
jgi:outer membrane protein assembly factor BamB